MTQGVCQDVEVAILVIRSVWGEERTSFLISALGRLCPFASIKAKVDVNGSHSLDFSVFEVKLCYGNRLFTHLNQPRACCCSVHSEVNAETILLFQGLPQEGVMEQVITEGKPSSELVRDEPELAF